jgi:hypothetical protein
MMREHPEYPDEWSDPDHPQAEFWKSDPVYWQAELDYWAAEFKQIEVKRYAWLREWEKEHTGDMMGEVGYLRLRVSGEVARSGALAAMLRLHQLGFPETANLT